MRLIVAADLSGAANKAADIVERYVRGTGHPRLGLATGATMEPLFAGLNRRHRDQGLSFADVEAYLLDEYVGLAACDPCSFRNVAHRLFVDHVDFRPGAVHAPNPASADLDAECIRYERVVRVASIGLQVLGIGINGHIGFNEPGSPLDSITRVVSLSKQTRADNAWAFSAGRSVPTKAITQGIGTIGAAKELLLVACGHRKADVVASALEGPVTPEMPASSIQRHPCATVVLDASAAAQLSRVHGAATGAPVTVPRQ